MIGIKKVIASICTLLCVLMFSFSAMAEQGSIGLSSMTYAELNQLLSVANQAEKIYHTVTSSQERKVLAETKYEVEQYFIAKGITVSWPWFDYEYARDWNTYSVETRIDYKDANKKSHSDDVVSYVFNDAEGQYHVYMLKIGSEVIIDRTSQYPEPWPQEPSDLMWGNTNIGIMTLDELGALKTAVNDEIKLNHSTDSDISHFVQLLTKNRVEQYLLAQGLEASWPWASYEYVRDWDTYYLDTTVSYSQNGSTVEKPVHAEAKPENGIYVITDLSIGDEQIGRGNISVILSSPDTVPDAVATPEPTEQPVEEKADPAESIQLINGLWLQTENGDMLLPGIPYCIIEDSYIEYSSNGTDRFVGTIDLETAEIPYGGFVAYGEWDNGNSDQLNGLMIEPDVIEFSSETSSDPLTYYRSSITLTDELLVGEEGGNRKILYLDLATATDEALEKAASEIKAEQRARLTTAIEISDTTITLAKGKTHKLTASVIEIPEGITASKISWKSGDKGVATFSSGTVTAVAAGTTEIVCESTLSDGTVLTNSCTVTVVVPVSSITSEKTSYTLYEDEQIKPSITVKPSTATNSTVTYDSSDTNVVIIDEDGNFIAMNPGKATVTVSALDGSGKTLTINVTVKEREPVQAAAQVDQTTYIGNKSTKKFHYPWCSSVNSMKESNMVEITGRDQAIKKGYKPCGRCTP